jgi:hypothetical protein
MVNINGNLKRLVCLRVTIIHSLWILSIAVSHCCPLSYSSPIKASCLQLDSVVVIILIIKSLLNLIYYFLIFWGPHFSRTWPCHWSSYVTPLLAIMNVPVLEAPTKKDQGVQCSQIYHIQDALTFFIWD